MNQYNKKRLANTGVDYTPIYISAYDTRDAQIEDFLKKYAAYYYDGPMNDTFGRAQLTDDIIQGATRLMNNNTPPQISPLQNEGNNVISNSSTIPNNGDLKQILIIFWLRI